MYEQEMERQRERDEKNKQFKIDQEIMINGRDKGLERLQREIFERERRVKIRNSTNICSVS